MKKVSAYCPASLSLLFKACRSRKILESGSVGLGFTVNLGVTATVKESKESGIFFNNEAILFPTVSSAVKKITDKSFNIFFKSSLPLGYGFGLSAASTISALLAINSYTTSNYPEMKLYEIAHVSEIENMTGLGTVGTVFTGGFSLKTKAGIPPETISFPFTGRKIYVSVIDRLLTPSILKNKKRLAIINSAADSVLQQIPKETTLENILSLAYEYDIKSGLLSDKFMLQVIKKIRSAGGQASMAKLGKVIISSIRPSLGYNYPVQELFISDNRPELL